MVKARGAHMSKSVLLFWVIRESFQEAKAWRMRLEGWGGRKPFASPNRLPMCVVFIVSKAIDWAGTQRVRDMAFI